MIINVNNSIILVHQIVVFGQIRKSASQCNKKKPNLFDGLMRRLSEGDGQEGQLKRLQQAISLYQGDLLEDCYADWAVLYRQRLRERYLKALNELIGQLMDRRQYSQAIQVLHRGLEVDDLRESFHRQLTRVCAMSGRRSQAIVQYQRCAEILQRELGSDPSPETTALYQRILDGLPLD